jgi:tripartite ATP-independent transporter DctM subunit
MTPLVVGIFGICFLFLLMLLGMPIGICMALVGFVGTIILSSFNAALSMMGMEPFRAMASDILSVLPLFMLMGQFAVSAGISGKLFATSHKWLGHLPGGLAMATIAGCAGFGAICGSGVATALTFGPIVLPEMKKYKYDPGLATGCIAAGGTLAIMIPPSGIFIIYAILTQQSIAKLFIAGVIPGVLLAVLMMGAVYVSLKINPDLASRTPPTSLKEKLESLKGIGDVLILLFLVLGGIYGGVFTANEAAGIGASGALLIGMFRRAISWRSFMNALFETVWAIGMVFTILIGAMIFNRFLTLTGIPEALVRFTDRLAVPPLVFIAFLVVIYLVLGALFDELAITFLTVPIFFPIILAKGIDPIWFGVIYCMLMELGMILPPVGINCFVIAGVARDVPLQDVYQGIARFVVPMLITVGLIMLLPQIALFLPNMMVK